MKRSPKEVIMRLNPAYNAVINLKKQIPQLEFKKNKENASYCMIHLPSNNSVLTMAGKSYEPECAAHISIYQKYNEKETQGLSVFHYTWQGSIEENSVRTSVVLHVYFDRIGRYLNCQIKNRNTNETIQNVSVLEENTIKQYAMTNSQETLTDILQHISTHYANADKEVTHYLSELDKLSLHIETQLPKYRKVARDCINAMSLKDKWTFGKKDPRAVLLKQITTLFEEKCKNHSSISEKKASFYSQPKIQAPQKQIPIEKNKKITTQPLSLELLKQLEDVDKTLTENKQLSETPHAQKALMTLDLLNKKFSILAQGITTSWLENELINVLQQINAQHQIIETLFEKVANENNLEAVKILKPFISNINPLFFAELLQRGNLGICQFMMQNFDLCIYYLNFCAFGFSKNGDKALDESYILLESVIQHHEEPLLLEMLLQNGANPNYYGATGQNHNGALHLAIVLLKQDFVRVLLENGANPNPDTNTVSIKSRIQNPKDILTKSEINKSFRLLERQKGNLYVNEESPLKYAIATRDKAIIALLLEYGASTTKKDALQFDAIGQETCCNQRAPDMDILKLLIQHGADINAVQGSDNQTTALIFACQRNCLDSVKILIGLGANPNQFVRNKAIKHLNDNPKVFYLPITALQKAFVKNHHAIIHFLMRQNYQPVTFTTAATTFANYVINQEEVSINSETLCFELSVYDIQIKDQLVGYFDVETITSEIKTITQQSGFYFLAKQYELARNFFCALLLFGDKINCHSVLYNLASCHKNCDDIESAAALYEICANHAPESPNGRFAAQQLGKLRLLTASEQTTLFKK